jgi:hypothetical protein
MKPWKIAIVAAVLMLLTACNSTNPLIGPFDTAMNYTLGPYIEERLDAELIAGTKDEDFVKAKRLELQALRALILEAKGEANVE